MRAQRPGDILIVDSDARFLDAIGTGLGALGHNVEVCDTGQAARRLLEKVIFDVVVCALQLPDERGEELCGFIKLDEAASQTFVALTIEVSRDADAQKTIANYYSFTPREYGSTEADDLIFKPISAETLARRVMNLLRMRRYLQESTNAIGALMATAEGVEEQDKRRQGHCKRLATISVELGAVLGCDEWELGALDRAAYLHDIGMVTIHGGLAHKLGNLSSQEMDIIKTHTLRGEELCKPITALRPVLPIIRSHHERADGTGYPDRLSGPNIPRLAQIFIIPHLYEALRSWSPYSSALSPEGAIAVMRDEMASGFGNVAIFDAFRTYVWPGLEERLMAQGINWVA